MKYLQPKFSVGGAPSDKFRENWDRIFRRNKPEDAGPLSAPAAPADGPNHPCSCNHAEVRHADDGEIGALSPCLDCACVRYSPVLP